MDHRYGPSIWTIDMDHRFACVRAVRVPSHLELAGCTDGYKQLSLSNIPTSVVRQGSCSISARHFILHHPSIIIARALSPTYHTIFLPNSYKVVRKPTPAHTHNRQRTIACSAFRNASMFRGVEDRAPSDQSAPRYCATPS